MYSLQISSPPSGISLCLSQVSYSRVRIQHPARTCHYHLCYCILYNRPASAVLHPHSRSFLTTAPSIHSKNHAPHDGPANFRRGHPRQAAPGTLLQPSLDRLNCNVSTPCVDIPTSFNTSDLSDLTTRPSPTRRTHPTSWISPHARLPSDVTQHKPSYAASLIGKPPSVLLNPSSCS